MLAHTAPTIPPPLLQYAARVQGTDVEAETIGLKKNRVSKLISQRKLKFVIMRE
jgi:hypothetical protein